MIARRVGWLALVTATLVTAPTLACALDEADEAALERLGFALRVSDRVMYGDVLAAQFDRRVAAVEREFGTRVTGLSVDAPLPLAEIHGALMLAWTWQRIERAVLGSNLASDRWAEVLAWFAAATPWLKRVDPAALELWRATIERLRSSDDQGLREAALPPLRADARRLVLRTFPPRIAR